MDLKNKKLFHIE